RITKYQYTQSSDITLAHNLEKIIDPRGVVLDDSPVLTIGYSAIDRVATQRFAENDRDILFSIGETTTMVTDARGIDKIFKHLAENKREIVVDGFTTSIELNTDTLIDKITLPEGNSIRYTYDSQNENRLGQGNVKTATRTGKNGVDTITTAYTYDESFFSVKTVTDAKGNTTEITLDKKGNTDEVKLPGISTPYKYVYNTYGQLESVTDPEASVTQYEYYPENSPYGCGIGTADNRKTNDTTGGYLKQVVVDKGKDNITASTIYDPTGNILYQTDGAGVQTVFKYDNPFGEANEIIQGATASIDGQPAINKITTLQYD
ncbi:MAG: hypothetical protein GY739_06900, partial [Mesoflavibacter sp.]|nr:hypothetical protein [Mesoflavibacter sp.]